MSIEEYLEIVEKGDLEIEDKSSMMGMSFPHKILFNGQQLCIMKKKAKISGIPCGKYKLTIQSMFPFISAEAEIDIRQGENKVTFTDKEKFWDVLFTIDLILMVVHWFIHLPDNIDLIYRIVTDGYFVLWLIYEWAIRKKYFKISMLN